VLLKDASIVSLKSFDILLASSL